MCPRGPQCEWSYLMQNVNYNLQGGPENVSCVFERVDEKSPGEKHIDNASTVFELWNWNGLFLSFFKSPSNKKRWARKSSNLSFSLWRWRGCWNASKIWTRSSLKPSSPAAFSSIWMGGNNWVWPVRWQIEALAENIYNMKKYVFSTQIRGVLRNRRKPSPFFMFFKSPKNDLHCHDGMMTWWHCHHQHNQHQHQHQYQNQHRHHQQQHQQH